MMRMMLRDQQGKKSDGAVLVLQYMDQTGGHYISVCFLCHSFELEQIIWCFIKKALYRKYKPFIQQFHLKEADFIYEIRKGKQYQNQRNYFEEGGG